MVAGTIWAATAVPVTVTQGRTISTNEEQILEAKLAYEDLITQITTYQQTVDSVTTALRESRAALASQIEDVGEVERKLAEAGGAGS
ncbi:MAG TPA: hypothetical protein ENO14_02860, partial [Chromatiales bacterium]|nr:hypothetical protein [Chromatiales bacterium]